MCQCSPKDIWEHFGCSNNFPVGPLEHFELCFRKIPDFSSIQRSSQGEDDVQPWDVIGWRHPNLLPAGWGQKGGPFQGLVDCGRGCWPENTEVQVFLATSSFSLLINQVKEGELLEPNTSTLGLWGLRRYFHFVAYILGYNVNHGLRSSGKEVIRARSSAYLSQSMLAILVRSPKCSNSTRRSLTSKQGREYSCLFTPCLILKGWDCTPFHSTLEVIDWYHFIKICQVWSLIP